jgi:hypothetical protein
MYFFEIARSKIKDYHVTLPSLVIARKGSALMWQSLNFPLALQ